MRDQVDFLITDKHQSFLQVGAIAFDGRDQVGMARPAQIAQNKFAKPLQYLKKEMRHEVDFLCRWTSQFSINWYYYGWWVVPGMPKVLKITITQCLCNISRKNWVMELMSCILIIVNVFIILFVMGLTRHQSTRVNLQYLFDILRKKSGMKLGT